jgi:hypothetical protein
MTKLTVLVELAETKIYSEFIKLEQLDNFYFIF